MAAGATFEPIATVTTGSATTTITVSSIPNTYTDLHIKLYVPTAGASGDNICIRFNGDTGANYAQVRGVSAYPSASGDYQVGASYIYGVLTSTTNALVAEWDVFDYATGKKKPVLHTGSTYGQRTDMVAGTWQGTSAINSLTILTYSGGSYTMNAGTVLTVYGIARA